MNMTNGEISIEAEYPIELMELLHYYKKQF